MPQDGRQVRPSVRLHRRNSLDANSKLFELRLLLFFRRSAEDEYVASSFRHDALHQPGLERQAQARIEDYAQQRTATRTAVAVGKQWIAPKNRSRPDQHPVILMPQFLHVRTRHFAG